MFKFCRSAALALPVPTAQKHRRILGKLRKYEHRISGDRKRLGDQTWFSDSSRQIETIAEICQHCGAMQNWEITKDGKGNERNKHSPIIPLYNFVYLCEVSVLSIAHSMLLPPFHWWHPSMSSVSRAAPRLLCGHPGSFGVSQAQRAIVRLQVQWVAWQRSGNAGNFWAGRMQQREKTWVIYGWLSGWLSGRLSGWFWLIDITCGFQMPGLISQAFVC